jgi:hypothetical protein
MTGEVAETNSFPAVDGGETLNKARWRRRTQTESGALPPRGCFRTQVTLHCAEAFEFAGSAVFASLRLHAPDPRFAWHRTTLTRPGAGYRADSLTCGKRQCQCPPVVEKKWAQSREARGAQISSTSWRQPRRTRRTRLHRHKKRTLLIKTRLELAIPQSTLSM